MADTATKIPFAEGAAASTPAANKVVVYAKSDGLMYSKDDAGTETLMSSGGSGSVATDAIWDAKGDLAGGTGANTAAKLTVGTNNLVLVADSGQTTGLKWGVPVVPQLNADCSADVTLTADTIADATSVSVSLAAGTWVIMAQVTFLGSNAAFDYTLAAITDSSNVVYGESRGQVNNSYNITVPIFAVVTPGSTTTYKVRGQSGRTNNAIKRYSSGTQVGTKMIAIRVL